MEQKQSHERRKGPRIPVRLPLDYWESVQPSIDQIHGGLVADISKDGLCIHTIHRIEIGASLKIRVYCSTDEYRFHCIEGTGRVLWKSPHGEGDWKGYKYGLILTAMSSEDRDRIGQLLKELPPANDDAVEKTWAAGSATCAHQHSSRGSQDPALPGECGKGASRWLHLFPSGMGQVPGPTGPVPVTEFRLRSP
jgi:hypothetical protein